eukprot:TRINITY_DN15817_c0_g4_i2.p1 TRINITY_DN15817_c0_g4~~TRINITY_DN15817_c0_g4_i2.p1  ORF type:complete len:287 (+),score=57.26 TRINITY_DN15817_c0_g4_i2:132-992(+)
METSPGLAGAPSPEPAVKRVKTPTSCDEQAALVQSSSAESSVAEIRALPDTKGWTPSEKDINTAHVDAGNKSAPALPTPELRWGYSDRKRKHLYIWCSSCKVWVARFKINAQQGSCEKDGDGSCPHFMPAMQAAYVAKAHTVRGAASSSKSLEPPPKRQKNESQASSSRPAPTESPRPSDSAEVRTVPQAEGYDAPEEDQMTAAQTSAKNRDAPPLPARELKFGYFDQKKKDLYVWCSLCKVYVTVIKFNRQQQICSCAGGGSCAHWTQSARDSYEKKMREALSTW